MAAPKTETLPNMGILPQFFFPERSGRDYALTPYLQRLAGVPDKFAVVRLAP